MTYIIDLDGCELHPGDGKVFNDCINECWDLHYTYDGGFIDIQKCIYILILVTIYDVVFFNLYILLLVFLLLRLYMYCLILQKKKSQKNTYV
jgi:hypothetical protein